MKRLMTNILIAAALALVSAPAATAQSKINLNTANSAQLQTLSGIGPSLAERILEFRAKNGPFKKIEDLMNVRGIGQKKFDSLRDKITVGAAPAGGQAPKAPAKKPTPPKGPPGE